MTVPPTPSCVLYLLFPDAWSEATIAGVLPLVEVSSRQSAVDLQLHKRRGDLDGGTLATAVALQAAEGSPERLRVYRGGSQEVLPPTLQV